jgi:hypothetical protein
VHRGGQRMDASDRLDRMHHVLREEGARRHVYGGSFLWSFNMTPSYLAFT